jgi:hypothetical protein
MKTTIKLPEYIPVKYGMDPERDCYTQIENHYEKAVIGLPHELSILSLYEPILIVVNEDCRSLDNIELFCIHQTDFRSWYVGNTYLNVQRKKLRSLVLFRFSEDEKTFTVYYFPHYGEKNKEEGLWFTMDTIQCLLQLIAT